MKKGKRLGPPETNFRVYFGAWVGSGGFLRFVGFDVTTAYGLYPWRALIEILVLGAILTPVYMHAMQPWRGARAEGRSEPLRRVLPSGGDKW